MTAQDIANELLAACEYIVGVGKIERGSPQAARLIKVAQEAEKLAGVTAMLPTDYPFGERSA